jgi:hypothetical protein
MVPGTEQSKTADVVLKVSKISKNMLCIQDGITLNVNCFLVL